MRSRVLVPMYVVCNVPSRHPFGPLATPSIGCRPPTGRTVRESRGNLVPLQVISSGRGLCTTECASLADRFTCTSYDA